MAGFSLITCMMVEGNDTRIVEAGDLCELWLMHEEDYHVLLASCPRDKRPEMEKFIEFCKSGEYWKDVKPPVKES